MTGKILLPIVETYILKTSPVTVCDLWHKTTSLMTDAVSKNLKIGKW